MTKPPKPHYVYISHEPTGERKLVVMSTKQEVQELPLTFDLAMKFATDFMKAANELHKTQITQLCNKENQEDMFPDAHKIDTEDNNRTSA